jgi:hypothetical protein
MDAAILHAKGDGHVAEAIAARLAPADCFTAALRGDAAVTHGESMALFAVWSANAEAEGLGQAISRVSSRAPGRCVVVRADGTPLPPLPAGARVTAITDSTRDFVALLHEARGVSPVAVRSRAPLNGFASGASIGLAIYAGMFVAAGAWRSDELTEALDNGTAVPLAGALRSFQTASATAWDGAVEMASVQVAYAASEPRAAFAPMQRVAVTPTLDTTTVMMVAATPAPTAVPLDAPEPAPVAAAAPSAVEPEPAPISLQAIEVADLTATFEPATLSVSVNEAF